MQADGDHRADLRSLASEIWRHATRHVEGTKNALAGECSIEKDGCRAGFGHGGIEGSVEGKLVSPDGRQSQCLARKCTEPARLGLQSRSFLASVQNGLN